MEVGEHRTAGHHELGAKVIDQLQAVHALKSGALHIFAPMLAEVHRQKEGQTLPRSKTCWRR